MHLRLPMRITLRRHRGLRIKLTHVAPLLAVALFVRHPFSKVGVNRTH
jgi:hypothetical protein